MYIVEGKSGRAEWGDTAVPQVSGSWLVPGRWVQHWKDLTFTMAVPLTFLPSSPHPPNLKKPRLPVVFELETFSPDILDPYQPGWCKNEDRLPGYPPVIMIKIINNKDNNNSAYQLLSAYHLSDTLLGAFAILTT